MSGGVDREDIAVDLMGFTRRGRLGVFASRAAPIQVNYLGNPGTTGADFFDYIIADRIVIPEDDHRFYSEKVVYMPATYQCSDSKRAIGETSGRRAAGLPEAGFVFCSFNRPDKIAPEMFGIWMRLLRRTPRGVLWLREWNPTAAANLRLHAGARGIAAEYEARAMDIAGNPAYLAEVKGKLQRNRKTHPLFDTAGYTRKSESAYEQMVTRHLSGSPPQAFAVEDGVTRAMDLSGLAGQGSCGNG